jgi:hypothetical protein
VDRLEHGRNLPHLGRGHVAENVSVPVHDRFIAISPAGSSNRVSVIHSLRADGQKKPLFVRLSRLV